jgi:hypothetical protein
MVSVRRSTSSVVTRFITTFVVALAVVGLTATRASAVSCPNGTVAGPFCIDGDQVNNSPTSGVPGQTAAQDATSLGGNKELGPINGSQEKVFNINSAPLPMLGFTSTPAKTDLSFIWTQVAMDPVTKHQWFYFAWQRVTTNGSGFIAIELEKNSVNLPGQAACTFPTLAAQSNPNDPTVIAFENACNPWRNRSDGDVMISWAQTGSSNRTIEIQKWCGSAACSNGAALPTWGPFIQSTTAVTAFCASGLCGEAAIDLTTDIFPPGGSCETFATTLPNTVTGSTLEFQANADYKDTVLFPFPPITNCGVLTVTKRTVDPDGKTLADPNNPAFGYTLANAGKNVRYNLDIASPSVCAANPTADHCIDGPAPQTQIVRPNAFGGPAIHGGQTQTHVDLIPDTTYTLVEADASKDAVTSNPIPYGVTPILIVCMDGSLGPGASSTLASAVAIDGTSITLASGAGSFATGNYIMIGSEKLLITAVSGGGLTLTVERAQIGTAAKAYPAGTTVTVLPAKSLTAGGSFQIVIPDGVQQTDCVITNQFVKTSPTWISVQSAKINDSFTLFKITPGANNQPTTVVFRLFSDSSCTLELTNTTTGLVADLTYTDDANNAGKKRGDANTFASGGIGVGAGIYYWRIFYAGDQFNNPVSTACGDETTTVSFVQPVTPKSQ